MVLVPGVKDGGSWTSCVEVKLCPTGGYPYHLWGVALFDSSPSAISNPGIYFLKILDI